MPTADTSPAQAKNPFSAQAVQETDSAADLVDIAALHEPARRAIERGRSRVRAGRPYLAVIIGEEGAGKSHLLWWLRRNNLTSPGLFVSVAALPDLAQPFRHALRQLVAALCRKESTEPASDGKSAGFERPIDRLMWEILYAQTCDLLDAARVGMYQGPATLLKLIGPLCLNGGQPRSAAEFAAAAQPVWAQVEPGLRAYLLSLPTEAAIDSAARAVLIQYPYHDRRALCTAWLAGEDLNAKDRERIGAKQVINNEAAAKYVLCALCRLLTAHTGEGPGVPLTFAYDQTDAVAQQLGQPGVQGVAEVVAAIQAQGGATLQVLSCRPPTWSLLNEKPTRPGPSPAGQLKQVDDALTLGKPTVQLLRDLIAARAAQSSQLPMPDFDPATWPNEVTTPRAALSHLAARWEARSKEGVPVLANDVPTAKAPWGTSPSAAVKALPTNTRNAPSRPGSVQVSAKNASTPLGSVPLRRDAPSRPGPAPAPAKKDGPSSPPAAKAEAPAPSSQSPSVTWMAMATDEDPLAAALAKVDAADKKNAPVVTVGGVSGAIKPPTKPPQGAKHAPSKPLQPMTKKPASGPGKAVVSSKRDAPSSAGISDELPPSGSSPSISWLAMASGDDLSPASIGDSPKAKSPAKPAAAPAPEPLAPSSQSPSVTWMAMASDDDPLSKALAAAAESEKAAAAGTKPLRSTKERIRALGSQQPVVPTAERIMAALGQRDRVEEWVLAQEMGVPPDSLTSVLTDLEDQGVVRLMTLIDGQRIVAKP